MRFINDMIHMTEGEKLINYWWLWVVFIALIPISIAIRIIVDKVRDGAN